VKAVDVAKPPGRMRPTAFPLSWAEATANHRLVRRPIRSSCQRQTKLAASQAGTRIAKTGSTCDNDRHEAKTATRPGSSR
jgi:hypothetical protein